MSDIMDIEPLTVEKVLAGEVNPDAVSLSILQEFADQQDLKINISKKSGKRAALNLIVDGLAEKLGLEEEPEEDLPIAEGRLPIEKQGDVGPANADEDLPPHIREHQMRVERALGGGVVGGARVQGLPEDSEDLPPHIREHIKRSKRAAGMIIK